MPQVIKKCYMQKSITSDTNIPKYSHWWKDSSPLVCIHSHKLLTRSSDLKRRRSGYTGWMNGWMDNGFPVCQTECISPTAVIPHVSCQLVISKRKKISHGIVFKTRCTVSCPWSFMLSDIWLYQMHCGAHFSTPVIYLIMTATAYSSKGNLNISYLFFLSI